MKIGNVKDLKMNLKLFGEPDEDEDFIEDEDLFEDFEDFDDGADDGSNDEPGKEPEKEKTFTQAELDEIVKERLAREKKKPAEESPLEAFVRVQAAKFNLTPEQYIAQIARAQEMEELEAEAKKTGKDVKTLELEKRLAAVEKDRAAIAAQQEFDARWAEMEKELIEKYPKLDLKKLDQNEQFVKFLKNSNPNLRLVEVYENYVELTGKAAEAGARRAGERMERSVGDGRDRAGEDVQLTKTEMALCKQNGIDPKKFIADKKKFKSMM